MSDTQYIVSARKYRPATFKSVVGQKNLTDTLKNAIETRRLAQAYLFCGPRGVGKTSCARIFAKTINCLTPTSDGEACGNCESCRAVEEGNSFNIIELDAASNNSVDNIRNLTEQVNVPPTIGKYRVFIIDEVHMLSPAAFNAFLKTLEEPPAYVIFILATTEKHKVIPTILSRCQIYDFKRITIQDMVEHLQYVASQENIHADVESLNVIAKKADGAMRDALSIFDQVAASSFGNITYESTISSLNVLDYEYYFRLVDTFRAGDPGDALMIYKEIRDRGFDSLFFVNGLASHIRDLMVAFSPQTSSLLEVADDIAERYTQQARSLPIDWHYAAMKILNACDIEYRTSSNKQLLVELTLIRLCQLLNPPTPPFDRVENDDTPLRDPASPPSGSTYVTESDKTASVSAEPTTMSMPKRVAEPVKEASSAATENSINLPQTSGTENESSNNSVSTEGRKTIRGKRKEAANKAAERSNLTRNENENKNPVSDDAFLNAWQEYMAKNMEKHILISAMRKTKPERISDSTFKVTVDHPALRQAFDSEMSSLIDFLRGKLHNDHLTLIVEIDANSPEFKGISQQDLLKEIIENNPLLADFIADIDGELS